MITFTQLLDVLVMASSNALGFGVVVVLFWFGSGSTVLEKES